MNPRIAFLIVLLALLPLSLKAQNQPPPATLRSLLLHQLHTTHTEADWFVPIDTALDGVTAEQANWQPPNGSHSVGQLAYQAIQNDDIPLIMGTVLFSAVLIVLVNILVDILYAVLNPRVVYT